VICRAGALTVAELAATGVASLLVPFPHAVDDHQTAMPVFCRWPARAILLPQDQMTPESISEIRNLSAPAVAGNGRKARELAKPEATAELPGCARSCPVKHKVKNIHFVGIGGAGMSGIAEVLANLGFAVSGSDLGRQRPPAPRRARRAYRSGTPPRTWRRRCGGGVHAVKSDNPKCIAARERARCRWCRARRCWPN
jgi:hypothetical protein